MRMGSKGWLVMNGTSGSLVRERRRRRRKFVGRRRRSRRRKNRQLTPLPSLKPRLSLASLLLPDKHLLLLQKFRRPVALQRKRK